MCGIFGYYGNKDAKVIITTGLKRLEYRGYDSFGVAVPSNNEIYLNKFVGKIDEEKAVSNLPISNIGIGHTRWATHGGVTQENAHPHLSSDKSFALAQNGIVENYQELKEVLLEKGYTFISQTDTEIIVHLIEEKLKAEISLLNATFLAFRELTGRNTIILVNNTGNEIIAARNGSPLILGFNPETKEYFFSSDTLSFSTFATKMLVIENNQVVHLKDGEVNLYDALDGRKLDLNFENIDVVNDKIDKEGYDHFMIKEIIEQKYTIANSIKYPIDEIFAFAEKVKMAKTVYTIGAGTAGFMAGQSAYFLRKAGINSIELKSYETDSYKNLFTDQDIIIAFSQSGETSDTIEPLEFAKSKGVKIASIVNMSGSTISRMSDYAFYLKCGPEICVASTKAATAHMAFGYILASIIEGKYDDSLETVNKLCSDLESYYTEELFLNIKNIVEKLHQKEHFFVLGRGANYYVSLEGALKIKEITYKHFEGFAGGELKHGVIALIEKDTPVFAIVSSDENKDEMLNAAAQVKARGAYVVGIGSQNNSLFDEYIPSVDAGSASPIANVIPFQLFSYFLGIKLNRDPDKPRNLAKSVTVK